MTFLQAGGPGIGLFPDSQWINCVNRTGAALVVGDCVQIDLAGTATETTSDTDGSSRTGLQSSQFAAVIDPAAAAIASGIFGLALDATADNAVGRILVRGGDVVANVASATVAGSPLVPSTNDNQLALAADTTTTDGVKIIGIALEADTVNIAKILFNGVEGFGSLTAV